MNSLIVLNWDASEQEISESAIRLKYPRPDFRVTTKFYKSGEVRHPAIAREGLLFVFRGKCRCSFGENLECSITLEDGQYVSFPAGDYTVEPLERRDASIALVWDVQEILGGVPAGEFES